MKVSEFFKHSLALAVFLLICGSVSAESNDILTGSDLLKSLRQKTVEDVKPAEPQPNKPDVNDSNTLPEPATTEVIPIVEPQPQKVPAGAKSVRVPLQRPKAKGEQLFKMVPAESLFCVRVNNLDYTTGMIDRLLADIMPVPLGMSVLVRAQLAGLLGNPEPAGLDTTGSFAVFGIAEATEQGGKNTKPDVSVGALVPISDYSQFISGNPNCSQPDANGVIKITGQKMPVMPALKAGNSNYLLVGIRGNYDKLLSMARSFSAEDYKALDGVLSTSDSRAATRERIWLFINPASAAKFSASFGTAWLEQHHSQAKSVDINDVQSEQSSTAPKPVIDANEITAGAKAFVVSITPKPNLLRAKITLSAVPGSKLASDLSKESEPMAELLKTIGAKQPEDLAGQMEAITSLISRAKRADFVGTYDLMNLFRTTMSRAGRSLPQINTAGQSTLVYAGRFYKNKIMFDIAVPKENLANAAAVVQAMQQQVITEGQQQTADMNIPDEPNVIEDANGTDE